jgi:hypothetical protein
MVQDLPTVLPQWDSTDSASTEPPSGYKTGGWPDDDPPEKEYDNHAKQHTWRWLEWFRQAWPRTSDQYEDQPIAGVGDSPSTGAGGVALEGEFSAEVYAGGYRRGLVEGPSADHNYDGVGTGGKDTYWDLSRGGVWTATSVATGAGPPSLAAGRVIVYAVRVTDGGVKSLLKDYRPTHQRVTKAHAIIDLMGATLSTLKEATSSTAELMAPLRRILIDRRGITGGHKRNQHITEIKGTDTSRTWRTYVYGAENGETRFIFAAGCYVSASPTAANGGTWTAETADVEAWVLREDGSLTHVTKTGLTPGVTTWSEADWYNADSGTATTSRYQLPFGSCLKLGGSPVNTTPENLNLFPLVQCLRATAPDTIWTEILGDLTASLGFRAYTGTGIGESGNSICIAVNAWWRNSDEKWVRTDNAESCFLVELASHDTGGIVPGIKFFRHETDKDATWDNANTDDDWRGFARFGNGPPVLNELQIDGETPSPIEVKNTLYQGNMIHASGYIDVFDGDIVVNECVGCSASLEGGGTSLEVVLDLPMTNERYKVIPSIVNNGINIVNWEPLDEETFRFFVYYWDTDHLELWDWSELNHQVITFVVLGTQA